MSVCDNCFRDIPLDIVVPDELGTPFETEIPEVCDAGLLFIRTLCVHEAEHDVGRFLLSLTMLLFPG